jgi:Cadherin domain
LEVTVANGPKSKSPTLNDYTFNIDENTPFAATVLGSDPQKNAVQTYSFFDPVTHLPSSIYTAPDGVSFLINSTTGAITASRPFDYETTSSYKFTVEVTDKWGSDTGVVTVNVRDVNEFAVAFANSPDANPTLNSVPEHAASGTLVGITASAADADGSK